MKNFSFGLLAVLMGLLSACSSTQETTSTGTTPTPTVTVPVVASSAPVAEKPTEDKPVETETPPAETSGGGARLALLECSEQDRKARGCTKELKPVCAEVDTGIRCVRAPCPSTMQQTFDNACTACVNKNVRGYWAMSCEDMNKPTAP